jgi:ornithine decarboxylase
MTERIQEFLRNRRSEGQDTEPCLVVDLEVVRDNYQTFAKALAGQPRVLRGEGKPVAGSAAASGLDGLVLRHRDGRRDRNGAGCRCDADRFSYGNTIKKERDIARAFALGIRLFAVDCAAEGREDRPCRARRQGVLPHPL